MDAQTWKAEQKNLREAVRALRRSPDGRRALEGSPDAQSAHIEPPDLIRIPITSQRGAPGKAIIQTKKVLRRLLAPFVLEPQTRFNQAVAAALSAQREKLEEIMRLLQAVADAEPAESSSATETPAHAPSLGGTAIGYLGFEERFRGSSEAIGSRQEEYLDYFFERGEILDIGCGRGEFLAMLRERGTPARGVDLDEEMVARCHEQGLTADCAEAVDFLNRQPDEQFGGVFMSQVVEHLSTEHLVTLLDAIARKSSNGAVLIIETLNPESLPVVMRWFWLDPTHVRLVHPETLQYFMEKAGFTIKTVQFRRDVPGEELLPTLAPDDAAHEQVTTYNAAITQVNERLFGPVDYFVVGRNEA
jgi:O-antigen chain-terminating methyltransferase